MNARRNQENVVRNAKRILGLAGLAALALVCAPTAWAQLQPVQTQSSAARPLATGPATSPGVQSSIPAPVATQAAQNSPARSLAPKVQSEGIKIHGHWTIEVRNRDGSVASHTEFENSYISQSFFPNILSRTQTLGEWGIELGGSPSPCVAIVHTPLLHFPGVQAEMVPAPVCVIAESGPAIGATNADGSPCNPAAGTGSCSNNLQVSLNIQGNGNPMLTGSVVATNSGTISEVETIFSTCGPALSSTACATETAADSPVLDFVSSFTATTLPALGSGTCGGANQPPCAVPVIAQQTIQVSVQFSFQ